jgi:hypothetical protein
MPETANNFSTPILLIGFNRLDTTKRVLAAIREVKPKQLFFAVDAPRPGHQEEEKCRQVRNLVKEVDWECEVKTFFPEKNLGARLGVSGAITWFFNQVEEGIILEHDCLPDPSFFRFCQELLVKYRHEPKVMQISGNCFYPQASQEQSYYFSHIPHIWGWATWRRAWQHYDVNMAGWPADKQQLIKGMFADELNREKWTYLFDKVYLKQSETWDFQFAYAILAQGGVSIIPCVNLVSNIGFGQDSLHSQDESSPFANVPAEAMVFPLRHPAVMVVDYQADLYISRHNFSFGWGKYILRRIGLFGLAQKIYLNFKR